MLRPGEASTRAEFGRRGPSEIEGDPLGKVLSASSGTALEQTRASKCPPYREAAPVCSHLPSVPLQSRALAQAPYPGGTRPPQVNPSPLLPPPTWRCLASARSEGLRHSGD